MAAHKLSRHLYVQKCFLAALVAALFLCQPMTEASVQGPVRAGQALAKKLPHKTPHSVPKVPAPTIASVTRRSLASSDNAQWNINSLLQRAVDERRINDIERLALQQRYSAIPGRGDFALLECLKVQSCDLKQFPDLATAVGRNQLHLQHAARCVRCNKINIYKLSGNTIEGLMDSYYQRGGWTKLKGEIGNSGIDGLYYKLRSAGQVSDVLVTEAKFNQSILQETRSGTQLCKQWILDNLARLRNLESEDIKLYEQITDFVERDVYRAQLWRMNVDDDRLFIWREHVSSKGRTIVRWRIYGKPPWNEGTEHVIDMLKPGSNFDRQILNDYEAIMSRSAQQLSGLSN